MTSSILAIDFGTSFTAAALSTRGQVQVLGLPPQGEPRIPSAVAIDESGHWMVGRRALAEAQLAPDRVERTPKRTLADRVQLGDHMVAGVDLVAAVYRVVIDEARRSLGGDMPGQVRLTYPARWVDELKYLRQAASLAGIPAPDFIEEPVAAAVYLVSDAPVPQDGLVAVYDLGGGTFDTAVVRRRNGGFVLHGPPGGEQLGGEDFDDILFRHLGKLLAAGDWEQLEHSAEPEWRDASSAFKEQIRVAKEQLSEPSAGYVDVPLRRPISVRSIRLTREELETQLRGVVENTVQILVLTLTAAGVSAKDLAAIYLTGGSSRIPLVGRLIRDTFNREPSTWRDPKTVVALGAAQALPSKGLRAEPAARRSDSSEVDKASSARQLAGTMGLAAARAQRMRSATTRMDVAEKKEPPVVIRPQVTEPPKTALDYVDKGLGWLQVALGIAAAGAILFGGYVVIVYLTRPR